MAFNQTEQEISNLVNEGDNKVIIADGVDPSRTATVNSNGELKVIVTGGGSAGQLVEDGVASGPGDVGRISVGFDGTNYQFISVDSSGRLVVNINTLPAVTQGTSPWVVSGTVTADAGTGPWPVTDNGGSLTVDNGGTFPVQAAQSGTWDVNQGSPNTNSNAWPVKITDGTTTATVDSGTQRLRVDTGTTSSNEEATFIAISLDTAVGNNKSMISIANTHATLRVKIKQIIIRNPQTVAVTGVMADFRLLRCTSHSAGTLLTPQLRDTTDSLDAAITIRTGATITGEAANPLDRWKWSSDEHGVGTLDQEGLDKAFMNCFPMASIFDPSEKRITLRQNEGITLKQVTNSTAGNFDIIIVFTVI